MRAREREHLVSEALAGRISVLCATQAFKIGLDIPTLDTLYCVLPMSNTGGLEQLLGRIRRPRAGREFATFRYFVDDGSGLLRGCARSTHRDVSELGADVIVVPEWHKPAETVDTTKTRSKLRKIAARDPWLFNQAFFNSAAPTSERAYVRRMGERDED
jgi:superfamily II DNA or RNA helicase